VGREAFELHPFGQEYYMKQEQRNIVAEIQTMMNLAIELLVAIAVNDVRAALCMLALCTHIRSNLLKSRRFTFVKLKVPNGDYIRPVIWKVAYYLDAVLIKHNGMDLAVTRDAEARKELFWCWHMHDLNKTISFCHIRSPYPGYVCRWVSEQRQVEQILGKCLEYNSHLHPHGTPLPFLFSCMQPGGGGWTSDAWVKPRVLIIHAEAWFFDFVTLVCNKLIMTDAGHSYIPLLADEMNTITNQVKFEFHCGTNYELHFDVTASITCDNGVVADDVDLHSPKLHKVCMPV
jgi:hypothetical protein